MAALREDTSVAAEEQDYESLVDIYGDFLGRTDEDGELSHAFSSEGIYLLVGVKKGYFPGATGIYLFDSAGRSIVVDHNCPIDCGGVLVNPGDIIFGDIDGVVVIPRELEKEVIPLALEKVSKENLLRDAYNKYGIL